MAKAACHALACSTLVRSMPYLAVQVKPEWPGALCLQAVVSRLKRCCYAVQLAWITLVLQCRCSRRGFSSLLCFACSMLARNVMCVSRCR